MQLSGVGFVLFACFFGVCFFVFVRAVTLLRKQFKLQGGLCPWYDSGHILLLLSPGCDGGSGIRLELDVSSTVDFVASGDVKKGELIVILAKHEA